MTISPPRTPFTRAERLERLPVLLRERILVLDGAMGTLLQRHQLSEADFRGERFADHRALVVHPSSRGIGSNVAQTPRRMPRPVVAVPVGPFDTTPTVPQDT